jgi:hypothetical protein
MPDNPTDRGYYCRSRDCPPRRRDCSPSQEEIFISGEVLYGVKRTNKNQEWGLRCGGLRETSGAEIFHVLPQLKRSRVWSRGPDSTRAKDSALPCRLGPAQFASWPIQDKVDWRASEPGSPWLGDFASLYEFHSEYNVPTPTFYFALSPTLRPLPPLPFALALGSCPATLFAHPPKFFRGSALVATSAVSSSGEILEPCWSIDPIS